MRAVKSKRGMVVFWLSLIVLYYSLLWYYGSHESPFAAPTPLNNYINNFLSERGNFLYLYFTAGAMMYVFRHSFPYSGWLALACAALILLNGAQVIPLGIYKSLILSLPVSYLIAYIGLQRIPKLPLYSRGDYSYGIYLYAYPIQQLLVYLFPGTLGVFSHFLLSTAIVTLIAMFSWHCIEKPVLRIRKKFSFTARKGDDNVVLPAAEKNS
jgi:peptidoglycan/LPS O-acetylase OafA/YrhL